MENLQRELESRGTSLVVLETSVMLLNNLLAFVGNLLTLVVVVRYPRLRTIPNKLVISLAVSNILMAIPSSVLTTAVLIKSVWPFNWATCQFQGYFGIAMAFASTETLALMSLNRYYRIVRPNNYRRIFTRRRTSIMIFAAWVIASVVQVPYVAVGHRYLFHPGKIYCNQDGRKPFSMILVFVFGGVPMSIVFSCCYKVFRCVRAHAKKRFRCTAWNRVNVEDIKVSRILLVMVLGYVICFSPVMIIEAIDFLSRGSYLPRQVYLFYTIAATLSTSVNPIIYGVMNTTFTREYKSLLCLDRIFKGAPRVSCQTGFILSRAKRQIAVCPLDSKQAELTENLTQVNQ